MNAITYTFLAIVGFAVASAMGAQFRVGSSHEIGLPGNTAVIVKFPGDSSVIYTSSAVVQALKDALKTMEQAEK